MSTQAVVSLVKDGKTVIKAICGCNGFKADILAFAINEKKISSIEQIYDLALSLGFGCEDCLVVMDINRIKFQLSENAILPNYRETFNKPKWNPRWNLGTAAYVKIVKQTW